MSRAFNRHVTDTISFAILGGFTIAGIVALVACCNGCGGDEFTRISKSDSGLDGAVEFDSETPDSRFFLDASTEAPEVPEASEVPDVVIDSRIEIPDASQLPDALDSCAPPAPASTQFPPECGSMIAVNSPAHYAMIERSSIDGTVLSCTANTTPLACKTCDFNCACLLNIVATSKSCSCAMIDQVLPVVTCK